MNIIRLNQQEVFKTPFGTSNQISSQTTITSSSSKSIFSLNPNIQNDENNMIKNVGENTLIECQKSLENKTNDVPFSFVPKKFVPAEKSSDWDMGSKSEEFSQDEKIKPKWSPNPSSQELEPRYKKIQPVFEKPKSPHKIS